jgi:hypothetical protein
VIPFESRPIPSSPRPLGGAVAPRLPDDADVIAFRFRADDLAGGGVP